MRARRAESEKAGKSFSESSFERRIGLVFRQLKSGGARNTGRQIYAPDALIGLGVPPHFGSLCGHG
jgi:hypothetical protein